MSLDAMQHSFSTRRGMLDTLVTLSHPNHTHKQLKTNR
jgi:hypothetical protein